MGEMRIPQPKRFGPLGNVPLVDKETPTMSFCRIAEELGPIFKFEFFNGFSVLFLSGHRLVAEVSDDKRFDKSLLGGLNYVRPFSGDGLFTSKTSDPNWRKAHHILIPSFSQQAMRGYHGMMADIAAQLVEKWARLNPGETIDVSDDMTKLTLDTIGLCGFNFRFNSFYREGHHPFIDSMVSALDEAMRQSTRIPAQNYFMFGRKAQFQRDMESMFALVDRLIAERRERGDQGETDLLARMLAAVDPETGEKLDDENIRYQIITFLIAGHETTSGLLSFVLHFLLQHPEVLEKARAEVDRVVAGKIPEYKEVLELSYLRMVLNESLRLYPTAPQYTVYAKEDTVIGGQYEIKKKQNIIILLPQLHRDREAWGEDAEEFRPERFADPKKIPPGAYKPFGNGQRACIGMQFALHEATLVLAMILKQFELAGEEGYEVKVRQTLTLKPDGFRIRVSERQAGAGRAPESNPVKRETEPASIGEPLSGAPLLVLFGSNLGTAEGIARELAEQARAYGVAAEADSLEARIGELPATGAVLIVCSSYNGKPPKNARKFVKWLDSLEENALAGVRYSVFGCGDTNWESTYQNVPIWIDEMMEKKGASRFSPRGEGNASGSFQSQFHDWRQQIFADGKASFGWKLDAADEKRLKVMIIPGRRMNSEEGSETAFAKAGKESSLIERVMKRFRLEPDDWAVLVQSGNDVTPELDPVPLAIFINSALELMVPATDEQIRELASHTICPPHRLELEALLEQPGENRKSMFDLLEQYPACQLPFPRFAALSGSIDVLPGPLESAGLSKV